MRTFRFAIALACLAVAALAPPAMAAPPGFSNDPAYASSIDQDTTGDFDVIAVAAEAASSARSSATDRPMLHKASIFFVFGASGPSAFAPIDPGRDIV